MTRRPRRNAGSFPCPHCGAQVPAAARFCRECGASEESGWDEEDRFSGEGSEGYTEDDDFDYDEFVAREFPEYAGPPSARRIGLWVLVIAVILGMAGYYLFAF